MTIGIELIRSYFRLKTTAEHFIGHPWSDPELLKIVKEEISKLKIEDLLNEAIQTGLVTCRGCGEQKMLSGASMCPKCHWENPLASLNFLG